MDEMKRACPVCGPEDVSRRDFMKTAAGAAVAASLGGVSVARAAGDETPESLVKSLYRSLSDEQKKHVALPYGDARRVTVKNNWKVVNPAVGKFFTADQQQLIKDVVKGLSSEEGHGRFLKVMKGDNRGGFGAMASAIFGNPLEGAFSWALTGRHLTLRCDGNSDERFVFGGPVFYGHAGDAADNFNERPDHPGNTFWYQALAANKLFESFDGTQRQKALLDDTPKEGMATLAIRGEKGPFAGLRAGQLAPDQKKLAEQVLKDILSPYRAADAEEAMKAIQSNGGVDALHFSFYKDEDMGSDKVWDNWMVQGPTISWFYRGNPHVHTWVQVVNKP